MPNIRKILPSQEALRAFFDYDPQTGILKWRNRPGLKGNWNDRYAGRVAGTVGKRGYVIVCLNHTLYAAHRVIWKLMFNEEPPEIDHRFHAKTDNRAIHLRAATSADNRQNVPRRKGKALPKGVDFVKSSGKFRARIQANSKSRNLGLFRSPEAAHAAYAAAALIHHGEFARCD